MKRFNSTLFIFLLPAIFVALLAAAINLATLFIFSRNQQSVLSLVDRQVSVIAEASSLVVDFGHLHQVVSNVLDDASSGKLDEVAVYRIHSKIINDMAVLDQRIKILRKNVNELDLSSQEVNELQLNFDEYRNFVMMATDAATIDTKTATRYIVEAQQHYLSFAQNAHTVSSLIGDMNRSKITSSLDESKINFIRIIQIGLVGLVAMLGLSYFSAARLSRRMSKVIDAIRIIARKDTEPPALPHLVEMREKESGDIKILADAVLRFREALIERRNTESEVRIAATAFESQESLMITDADGVILRVNKAFTENTGFTAKEAVGQTPRLLKSGRHNADFYRTMWESIQRTGVWQGEIWDRRKNGEVYPKWLTISSVKNKDGAVTHYVGAHIDITERKAAEEKIQQLAFYDPLTRLPNRRLLTDRLQHGLASSARSGRHGALLFMDLDNFKTINDTLGHNVGDILLQQVAGRLESCVREGDTVARIGGDEFVVVLEDLNQHALAAAEETEDVSEKILATLNQPYQLATHEYRNTASIGVILFNGHQQSIDELMKQADISMYQAKKAGRNTLRFYDPQMQENITARASLESELFKALEHQQFQLHYQIQVDSSNRPFGAEALIRWMHPERGLIFSAQFIPLAEETGLILPIGKWAMEVACAQLKAWQQDAFTRDLVMCVNVSAKRFRQADFAAQVQAAVQRHAINPKLLKLELTESMLLEDIDDTIATMNELNAIGVRFSLDDFGTGYSSLQYLKRLPLDELKIDQSFVRDIATDSSDKAIVSTIIAMAQSLNLDVIAEGVETEEQRNFLLKAGCTRFQGSLFARPVPINEFEALLRNG